MHTYTTREEQLVVVVAQPRRWEPTQTICREIRMDGRVCAGDV